LNPVLIIDIAANVANGVAGDRVLIVTLLSRPARRWHPTS